MESEFASVLAEEEAETQPEGVASSDPESAEETPADGGDGGDGEQETPGAVKLRAIQEKLGMPVIAYWSASHVMDRWDVKPLGKLLETIGPVDNLAVIIQSSGGDSDTAHTLLQLLREYAEKIHIYVPTHAASAATLFAIGGDTLWMGPASELSPIDPQVPVDPNILIPAADPANRLDFDEPFYVPAHVIRDFLEFAGVIEGERKRPQVDTKKLEPLLKPLNPWILGWYEAASNSSRNNAYDALRYLMASEDDVKAKNETIVAALLDGYASHEASILRSQAKRLGLPVRDIPADVLALMDDIADFYDAVLREQRIGRVLECVGGLHAVPARPQRFCDSCGEASDSVSEYKFCPACGTPFAKRCAGCSGGLRAGWAYCPRCGVEAPDAHADLNEGA